MKQVFYISSLLGVKFAMLINDVDREIGTWEKLMKQKSISEERFLNAFLVWQDILYSISDEIDNKKIFFDLNEEDFNDKKNKGKTLDRTTHYRVSTNTPLAKMCFKKFTALTRLHAILIASDMSSNEKTEEFNKFIAFIGAIYDELTQALRELKNAILVAKKQSGCA
ncbi:MAG: hypothetical protein R3Y11_11725 [Pseudomonadota bacterium]